MTKRGMLLFAAMIGLAIAGCGDSSVASSSHAAPMPATSSQPVVQTPSAPPASAAPPAGALSVLSVEHQVDVATQRDGVVVSVAKDEGSMVNKGDILGQLDDRTLQIELVKARDDLLVAQNNVKYKEAELKAKSAAFDRQQQLRKLGLSSQADLEAADFEAKGAEYDLHGWEAMAESSQAEIHRLELEIDQTRLRAPFSGAVVTRYIREGQEVAKGDKCFRVSQLGPLQVQFQVAETAGPRPRDGALVNLSLVEDSGRSLTARVVKVSPIVDPASDSYNVTAELTGKGLADLRPGMAVRVVWPGTGRSTP
ncbi:MAG TPA: efflux RND transporter periplasmic adaptor subunit [Candidatus Acidoferrales bacterium]|nr:efflux RND transporter periplasmic adaptor subunit [Candidatus Acidoferrales bacterium]